MRKISAIVLFILTYHLHAQSARDWIDFGQEYYKIKVTEDGLYRVTANELEQQGFPTSSVPAGRLQLFRRGEEVSILVNSTGGILNYLEFYGERNKGEGDTELYLDPDFQPHTEYNLFTDTAAYFLTWKLTAQNGKRMQLSTLNDPSGLTAQPYHLNEKLQLRTNNYGSGIKFGTGSSFTLSDYDDGEGWTGNYASKGSFNQFTFNLENPNTSANPELEVVLVGGNTLQHNVDILVGPSTSLLRNIGNVQFSNRGTITRNFAFENSDINANGTLVVRTVTTGFSGAADRVSTALVRVTYPEDFSMNSSVQKVFSLNTLPANDRAYLRVTTDDAANTRIFEISDKRDPRQIVKSNFSDRFECIIPGPFTQRKVLAITGFKTVARIDAINFNEIIDANYNIITHPALRAPASDGLDPIQAYANYRASAEGGTNQTQIISIFQLFDQFNYGDASPLALSRLAQFLYDNGDPGAIFIIGKGRTTDLNFYRNTNHNVVNVPTFGQPGGDIMFVRGLGDDPFYPMIPIGRLNAFTSEHVKSYLDKVKEMETLPFDDLFRKNVLQLSGGQSASELSLFRNYINSFRVRVEGDFLGGRAINYSKETSSAVEVIDVVKEVNDGLGLITFFGHSGSTVTDIEIGLVTNAQFGYNNKGKYPVILVNGCNAGNIFKTSLTFGEDWIRAPEVGAIGVLAHTDFAASSTLKRWSDLFYEFTFQQDETFAEGLGQTAMRVSQRYFDIYGRGNFAQTQVFEMQLQGDPLVKVFGADAPDYEVTESDISFSGFQEEQLLAAQDSFKIAFPVRNFGRAVSDSLLIEVRRTLPNGLVTELFEKIRRPLREDSIQLTIYNDPAQVNVGTNVFEVILDPLSETTELDEGNNYARVEVDIFQGNTANLFPKDYGLLSDQTVNFLWQPTDIFEESRAYALQVDTLSSFNSSYLKTFSVTGISLLQQSVDFSVDNLPDSTVIYWRTRFANPETEQEENWEENSFVLINQSLDGWGQYERGQYEGSQLVGVEFSGSSEEWEFQTSDSPIDVVTFGSNYPGYNYNNLKVVAQGINYLVTGNPIDPRCAGNTINALIFDNESTTPYRPIPISGADVSNRLVCGRLPQMIYNLTQNDVIGSSARLEQLINNMDVGDHILLFNIGQVNFSTWDAGVLSALEEVGIGSSLISSLTNGQPVIMLGRKGDSPGSATAVLNDGSGDPITEQGVQLLSNVRGSFVSGSINSPLIGPANSWGDLDYAVSAQPEDNTDLDVIGVQADGSEVALFNNLRIDDLDLSTIDAETYPRLRLRFSFRDANNLTPPQLDFWQVNFTQPPDGILLTDQKTKEILSEGQEVAQTYHFYNYSKVDFSDSLDVRLVLSSDNGNAISNQFRIGAPLSGDSTQFDTDISTSGQVGINSLFAEVSPNENEQFDFNNKINLAEAYDVQADITNPIIDVMVDGSRIVNGDIVSPEPVILIRIRDDNNFLFKNDTLGMDVQFREPCEGCSFERINFSDPRITVVNASAISDYEITFTPGSLPDGIYALSAQARDESGNLAGAEPYVVEFEVVTESSITHFYPYPNPFSTQTRFVFTLTGSSIPERIKIQILTISGRVVKEINQDEIGAIKIGHNVSEYAWDGTDEFGDQLANGVYFYRVLMESEETISHRRTTGDGAFKNGFGKLYILR